MVTEKPWKPDLWAQGSSREGWHLGSEQGLSILFAHNLTLLSFLYCPKGSNSTAAPGGTQGPSPFLSPFLLFFSPSSSSSSFSFSFLFFIFDKVSLCTPGWPGTYSVSQAGLKLTVSCHGWRPNAGWAATPSSANQWEKNQVCTTADTRLCAHNRATWVLSDKKKVSEVKEEDSVCDRSL